MISFEFNTVAKGSPALKDVNVDEFFINWDRQLCQKVSEGEYNVIAGEDGSPLADNIISPEEGLIRAVIGKPNKIIF